VKHAATLVAVLVVLVIVLVVGGAFYIVTETEQVVITQFGKPVGEPVTTASR
jgi:membrane protease subunit HflC